jgi:hypothetical protein
MSMIELHGKTYRDEEIEYVESEALQTEEQQNNAQQGSIYNHEDAMVEATPAADNSCPNPSAIPSNSSSPSYKTPSRLPLNCAQSRRFKRIKAITAMESIPLDRYKYLQTFVAKNCVEDEKEKTIQAVLELSLRKAILKASTGVSDVHNFLTSLRRRSKVVHDKVAEYFLICSEIRLALSTGTIGKYLFVPKLNDSPEIDDTTREEHIYDHSPKETLRLQLQLMSCLSICNTLLYNRYKEELESIEVILGKSKDISVSSEELQLAIEAYNMLRADHKTEQNMPAIAANTSKYVLCDAYTPYTVLQWYNEFKRNHYYGFIIDTRGHWERVHSLDKLNLRQRLKLYMSMEKLLTVDNVVAWLTQVLTTEEAFINDNLAKSLLPLTRSTVHSWMVKAGATHEKTKKTYYTDNHDSKENIKYRSEQYLPMRARISSRSPEWVSIPISILDPDEKHKDAISYTKQTLGIDYIPQFTNNEDGVICTKIHVDYLTDEAHQSFRETWLAENQLPGEVLLTLQQMEGNYKHNYCGHTEKCLCNKMAYHIGQDESCFKEHATTNKEWKVDGKGHLRPKSDGRTEMISAFQDCWRGFGFDMTDQELQAVNAFRALQVPPRPALQASPGIVHFTPGSNNDGWWGYECFAEQVVDLMDCIEVVYEGSVQMVLEVDHSSGM